MPGPGSWSAGDILTAADLNAIGTWSSYSPVLVQNGTRAATVNSAKYCQINKLCIVNVDLTCNTTGSAGSVITVSLPINQSTSSSGLPAGSGKVYDSSATDVILTQVLLRGASTVNFVTETATEQDDGLGVNPSFTLGANDIISFSIVYQTV